MKTLKHNQLGLILLDRLNCTLVFKILIIFLVLTVPCLLKADNDTTFVEGVLLLKLSDKEQADLPTLDSRYHGEYPYLSDIIDEYKIKRIEKMYPNITYFSRYYRIKFDKKGSEQLLIADIKKRLQVDFIEKQEVYKVFNHRPNDQMYYNQWMLPLVNAHKAWDVSKGSPLAKIAVIDDGFRLTHEDLSANFWVNQVELNGLTNVDDDNNGYVDDIKGWDVGDNDNDPTDNLQTGHGTLVAGAASAVSNNFNGIASIGYNVPMIPIKASANSSSGYITNGYDGIVYAVAAGAKVINLSWGGYKTQPSTFEQSIIDYAYNNGAVIIAAAGNDHNSYTFLGQIYPASYNHVIAVAATTKDDLIWRQFSSNHNRWDGSNYGSYIDISAPGENIFTTSVSGDNTYTYATGTSLASPIVAGAAALIISANPSLSPSQVENCLKSAADPIDFNNPDYAGQMGTGRLNVFNAVQCVSSYLCDFKVDNTIDAHTRGFCTGWPVPMITFQPIVGYSYNYDFGDGSPIVSGVSPFHTYNNVGIYDVTLIIKNSSGVEVARRKKEAYIFISDCNSANIKKEHAKWYFGKNANIDFTSGKATPKNELHSWVNGGPIYDFECLSHSNLECDNTGNLVLMQAANIVNSREILAVAKTSTSATYLTNAASGNTTLGAEMYLSGTIKDATSNSYMFMYATQGSAGLRFANLDLATNTASVISPYPLSSSNTPTNILLNNGNVQVANALGIVPHACNNNEYWIILHGHYADQFYKQKFIIYRYNSSSKTFAFHNTYDSYLTFAEQIGGWNYSTFMKVSPDGQKIAIINSLFDYMTILPPGGKLYSFNANTGEVSFRQSFNNGYIACEFSANSRFLYVAERDKIFQYDVTSSNLNDNCYKIAETSYLIPIKEHMGITSMQLGPDKKIYVALQENKNLSVIHFPDNKFSLLKNNNCGFEYNGLKINKVQTVGSTGWVTHNNIHTGVNGFLPYLHNSQFPVTTLDFSYSFDNCNSIKLSTNTCANNITWTSTYGTISNPNSPVTDFIDNTSPTTINQVTLTTNSGSLTKVIMKGDPGYYSNFNTLINGTSGMCNNSDIHRYSFVAISTIPPIDLIKLRVEWTVTGGQIHRIHGNEVDVIWDINNPNSQINGKLISITSGCIVANKTLNISNYKLEIQSSAGSPILVGSSTNLTSTPIYNSYPTVNYQWYRNNFAIPNSNIANLQVWLPGIYYVEAMTSCGIQTSNKITIRWNCSSVSGSVLTYSSPTYNTPGVTTWSPTSLSSPVVYISGDLTVEAGAVLDINDMNVIMSPCSRIVVRSGARLTINNTVIASCDKWQGVKIENTILQMNNSEVSDAQIGVFATGNASLAIHDNIFTSNNTHIVLHTLLPGNTRDIIGNRFLGYPSTARTNCNINYGMFNGFFNPSFKRHVYFESADGVIFDNNILEGYVYSNNDPQQNAIEVLTSTNCSFTNNSISGYFKNGVLVESCNNVNIGSLTPTFQYSNTFQGYIERPVEINNSNIINIFKNQLLFEIPGLGSFVYPLSLLSQIGMLLKNNTNINIEGNLINGNETGLLFLYNSSSHMITKNLVENNKYGVVISYNEHPINGDPNANQQFFPINIEIYCNKFFYNEIAILGSGDLLNQQTNHNDAANEFNGNINWDILWQDNNSANYLYHFTLGGIAVLNQPPQMLTPVIINGVLQTANDLPENNNVLSPDPCRGTWFMSTSNIPKTTLSNTKLYPNPFYHQIEVDLPEGTQQVVVEIFDLNGKKVLETTISKDTIIQTQNLNTGMYLISCRNIEGVRYSSKMLKIEH